jgi:Bacteriocin-protection, YdeI or OmpD-Associated/Domain of unknown function (DUF1905)
MAGHTPKGAKRPAGAGEDAPRVRFRTTILRAGKTATGIEVPAELVATLGTTKRPPVRVTINGYTYRSTVAMMGGVFMVSVSAEHREGAGVAGGDEVDVELELDTAPRDVAVPADLAEALEADPDAKSGFGSLSYSHKRAHVLAVEGAKTAETRQRRIAKVISMLRQNAAL